MKSLKLYEIANEYQFLEKELYDEETGAINELALEKLQELAAPIEEKCINIVKVFKSMEAEQAAIEKERKAMAAREKALNNQIDRLKDYLSANMQRCNIDKISCPQFVISLQKNPPAIDYLDKTLIPDEYVRKVSFEYDAQRMKDDILKNGVIIPGVEVVQRYNIRIR